MIMITDDETIEIFSKYMTLNYEDIDEYLEQLSKHYDCTMETIKKRIELYARNFNDKKYQEYLDRKVLVKINKYEYVKMIKLFLSNMEENIVTEFKKYDTRTNILRNIKKYLLIFPNEKEKIDKLIEKVNEYFDNLINSKQMVRDNVFKLKINECDPKYAYEIKNILNSKSDDKAITKIRGYRYTENEIKNILSRFENRYANSSQYIDRLKKLFDEYKRMTGMGNEEDKNNIIEQLDVQNEKYNQAMIIVNEMINGNYSIEQFCHINPNYNISDINKYISISAFYKQNRIYKITNYLDNIDNTEFIKEINYIVEQITIGDFDIVDYYMLTKLSFKDFIEVAKKYQIFNDKVNSFFNRYNSKIKELSFNFKFSEKNESKVIRIINGNFIDSETKKIVFEFLNKNDIPINLITYKLTLNKYLNGKLDLNSKQYTKQ